jgi:hypothetical protein
VIEYIEKELDIEVDLVRYRRQRSLFDVFADAMGKQSFFVGKGIANGFFPKAQLADSVSIFT